MYGWIFTFVCQFVWIVLKTSLFLCSFGSSSFVIVFAFCCAIGTCVRRCYETDICLQLRWTCEFCQFSRCCCSKSKWKTLLDTSQNYTKRSARIYTLCVWFFVCVVVASAPYKLIWILQLCWATAQKNSRTFKSKTYDEEEYENSLWYIGRWMRLQDEHQIFLRFFFSLSNCICVMLCIVQHLEICRWIFPVAQKLRRFQLNSHLYCHHASQNYIMVIYKHLPSTIIGSGKCVKKYYREKRKKNIYSTDGKNTCKVIVICMGWKRNTSFPGYWVIERWRSGFLSIQSQIQWEFFFHLLWIYAFVLESSFIIYTLVLWTVDISKRNAELHKSNINNSEHRLIVKRE